MQFFGIDVDVLVLAVNDRLDRQLGHLPDFFFQRHLRQELVHGGGKRAGGGAGRRHVRLQERLAVHGALRGVICGAIRRKRQTPRPSEQHSNNDYVEGQTSQGHPNLPPGMMHARDGQFHARFRARVRDYWTALGHVATDKILKGKGPPRQWNSLRLRFLRTLRLERTIEGNRLANECLERSLVNFFSFVDVNRPAHVSFEARVEETRRILQKRALGERKLHDLLVGFAGANDSVVRPNRSAPLPLLDRVRVCRLDQLAHSAEGFSAPVPKLGDSFRDKLRGRLALARARFFHALILEGPDIFICVPRSDNSVLPERSFRNKPPKQMAFPHPQSRNNHDRHENTPHSGRVLRNFFERTVNITQYRNAKNNV